MLRAGLLLLTLVLSPLVAAHKANTYEGVADDLAEQLVVQLKRQGADDGFSQLGLTRWVMADSLALPHPHDSVTGLSHQLSESLYTHLQERNVRLIDYRAQDYVSLSKQGATLLTRDPQRLNQQPLLDWVLVGTMAPEQGGVIVNLRVIDRTSQQVLASANRFVPKHLYADNRRSEMVGGKLQRNF
ncbi:hypothetical protein C5610_02775 [Idiomarina sp. OT37-5b]|jgi:TolB-like protein|uniref:FlgO family outer membrane protein n=1 Tax=Idiomarina sp. OT37-5b TaxID=2100422 RepID=UPI000CF8A104|nr:FlgO family outer membrane protein [Idiomarina sp. OT37-5b]AVJ55321.1 hypothetical protein C5610_02775 [Idiomarina sp. OT37-5b]